MPRITKQEQYRRHSFLNMLWSEPNMDVFFSVLPIEKQWQLHDYYQPSQNLSQAEFDEHLQITNQKNPPLCRLAGRSFNYIEKLFIELSQRSGLNNEQISHAIHNATKQKPNNAITRKGKSSSVTISVIAKSFDAKRLARAFLALAIQQSQENSPSPKDPENHS